MPDVDEDQRQDVRKFAFNNAGKFFLFVENEGGTTHLGRVVGYYEEMAQVVLECSHTPRYPIDPMLWYLKPVYPLEMHKKHTYVCVDQKMVGVTPARDPQYPHPCPRCKAPAFILFRTVECSKVGCENHPGTQSS